METILTLTGFLAVTAVCVVWHLRRSAGEPAAAAVATGPPCPRCREPVPESATFCPGCGVPRQVYEVVTAREVLEDDAGAEGDAPKEHAVVRADLCVGCGTCVDACPEEGAIQMVGKLAVVDKERCDGQANCVAACPVGGISMGRGEAVQRVHVPDVGPEFESNVPGIYIVGELGGRGLIKNAINEGKIAVEFILRELEEERERSAATDAGLEDPPLDLVIVGAGPAGLSASLEAKRSKLRFVVLEQGTLADTIRRYPRRKILLSEPIRVPLYGDLWIADTTKEALLEVWESIVASAEIEVHAGHRVAEIVREGDQLSVRGQGKEFRCRRVVLALGRRGTPRRLGVPGEDRKNVFYEIVEMQPFRGRKVLVVGGGDSALEAAVGLGNQPGTEVTLSYRGEEFTRAKERNRVKVQESLRAGKLRIELGSQVREIRPDSVALERADGPVVIPNDDVIVQIGGIAPFHFLEEAGVRMVKKDVPLPKSMAVQDA